LFIMEAVKRPGLDITGVAEVIHSFQRRYDIDQVIIDGANKQAVAELSNRHGLALTPADKTGKADFIDLLNSDLIQARIKVHPEGCAGLVEEWLNLVWDEKALARTGKRVEAAICPNHLSDAALYAWRKTYAYLATVPVVDPEPGTPEWAQEQERRMEEEAERLHRPRRADGFPSGDAFPGAGFGDFPGGNWGGFPG